ncbi:MAG: hypothetical protein ACRDT2_06510 [Natronosporangium sp.]
MVGFSAFALVAMVEDGRMVEQLEALERRGTDPRRVEALARCWASLRRAADEWTASAASVASAPDSAVLAGCGPEISTTVAALALGVTDSRVRQRLRAGQLPGRRVGCRWRVDVAAVRGQTG